LSSSTWERWCFFLRKVIWTVPDFTVDRYRGRLKDLHDQIESDGVFHWIERSSMSANRHPVDTCVGAPDTAPNAARGAG
jgi:hypothetical protein